MNLVSGFLIWAAHFFLLYAIGEFVGSEQGARIAVDAATAIAAAETAAAWRTAGNRPGDDFDSWHRTLALSGLAVAAVAITRQDLPALSV